ncbi:hypothetical protein CAPTEDRAFT_191321 [Capitella teleta]|uniref:Uncharacterized protein n=1 Tax=Capitella teleta TaxID=283909 RepID=R7U7F3_CAPTE|nr:hypothetical protein CAPTEDRAFT_191321 [Capitella teleta]|eukprot:ELU01894.1 hypothetical protein CAPTEDRAFT_191321 [Capitella teleta]
MTDYSQVASPLVPELQKCSDTSQPLQWMKQLSRKKLFDLPKHHKLILKPPVPLQEFINQHSCSRASLSMMIFRFGAVLHKLKLRYSRLSQSDKLNGLASLGRVPQQADEEHSYPKKSLIQLKTRADKAAASATPGYQDCVSSCEDHIIMQEACNLFTKIFLTIIAKCSLKI